MAPTANFLTGADGGATTSRTLGLQLSQNPSVTNVMIYVTYVYLCDLWLDVWYDLCDIYLNTIYIHLFTYLL